MAPRDNSNPALKLHLGCGGIHLDGWEHHDLDVDLRRKLPYENNSVRHIFLEHALEHLTPADAWYCLEECYRILEKCGVMRINVPDVCKLRSHINGKYLQISQQKGRGDGTYKSAIKALLTMHGHQSIWTCESLVTVLESIGFQAYESNLHTSIHKELQNIDSHWRTVGRDHNDTETTSVEGVK